MKKKLLAVLSLLSLLALLAKAQDVVFPAAGASGTIGAVAVNPIFQTGTYGPAICYPATGLATRYDTNVPDCYPNLGLGFGPAPATQTFTAISATVSTPIPAGEDLQFIFESATTGGSLGSCQITAGNTSCTGSFSASVTKGDLVSVAVRLYGSTSFTPPSITWLIQ